MIRFTAILWDVDDTLLDFGYSQRRSLIDCFHSVGREITEEMLRRYSEINDSYWKRLELGEVTKAQILTGRFLTLFDEYGIRDVDVEKFLKRYQENLGKIYSYRDDSLEICRALRGKVKQYVITNGVAATQRNKLELSGLSGCMEALFISEEVGVPKPQKGFFDHCLSEVGEADRSKLLIVGDSLTSDIKGGVQAGIPTCWYRPGDIFERVPSARADYERYTPDYEISELHQIFDVLGGGL